MTHRSKFCRRRDGTVRFLITLFKTHPDLSKLTHSNARSLCLLSLSLSNTHNQRPYFLYNFPLIQTLFIFRNTLPNSPLFQSLLKPIIFFSSNPRQTTQHNHMAQNFLLITLAFLPFHSFKFHYPFLHFPKHRRSHIFFLRKIPKRK